MTSPEFLLIEDDNGENVADDANDRDGDVPETVEPYLKVVQDVGSFLIFFHKNRPVANLIKPVRA